MQSMAKLQTVMADPAMSKAVENADHITKALALLESLEKSGSLGKIMAALK